MLKHWFASKKSKAVSHEEVPALGDGWETIQSAEECLQDSHLQARLKELKQLVSATTPYYQTLYGKAIHALALACQTLPHPVLENYRRPYGLCDFILTVAVTALKFRRGYMLPVGADTETCYREQESWTYAVFTSSVLSQCHHIITGFDVECLTQEQKQPLRCQPWLLPQWRVGQWLRFQAKPTPLPPLRSINALWVNHLIPHEGLEWLYSDPQRFSLWWAAIGGDVLDKPNVLQEILEKAQSALGNQTMDMPVNSSVTHSPQSTQVEAIQADHKEGTPAKEMSIDNKQELSAQEIIVGSQAETPAQDIEVERQEALPNNELKVESEEGLPAYEMIIDSEKLPTDEAMKVGQENTDALPAQNENCNLEVTQTQRESLTPTRAQPKATHLPTKSSKTPLAEHLLACLKRYRHVWLPLLNQEDAFCQVVAEGLLLVMPNTWEWFISKHAKSPMATLSQRMNHWNPDVLNGLLSSHQFIKNKAHSNSRHSSYLHRYVRGDWEKRDVLSGLLIAPEQYQHFTGVLPINHHLHPDPQL